MRNHCVLLASQTPLILGGLRNVVRNLKHDYKCYDGDDEDELISILEKNAIRLLLIDFIHRSHIGLRTLRLLKKKIHRLKTVVIINAQNQSLILQMAEIGIHSIIHSQSTENEIANAIRCVSIGDKYFSLSIQRYINNTILAQNDCSLDTFSLPQRQVVYLISKGYTSKEIGIRLNRSEKTVENCRCHLLKITGCKNAIALVDLFRQRNLLDFIPLDSNGSSNRHSETVATTT